MGLVMRPSADVVVYAPSAGFFYGVVGVTGGAELQSTYIARALALGGFRVRHVVEDAAFSRTPEGVEVVRLPLHYREGGLPRRLAIVRGLRRADGHVYIQRTAGIETGFAGVYARLAGRRFVFSASHDADFSRDLRLLRGQGGGLNRWTVRTQARIGMRCADAVVAQTKQQAEIARASLRLHPQVIPNFCDLGAPRPVSRDVFLWVGAFLGTKNPHSFLDLAERVSGADFVMVARERAGWERLAASVHARAARLANVELLPVRPRSELLPLYNRAVALVSTSSLEGFPNVFLEAWARGVPTLSLHVDPDGVIARNGLGAVASGSPDELVRITQRYVDDPTAADVAGDRAYRYVQETHSPEVVGAAWVDLVGRLLRER
jgi:glycosyltransferase involved in cell wall biosynthesis